MTDVIFFAFAAIYYTAEYFLLSFHIYLVDIIFIGYFLYRILYTLPKNKQKINKAAIIFNTLIIQGPITYLFKFMFDSIGLKLSVPGIFLMVFLITLLLFFSVPKLLLSENKETVKKHTGSSKGLKIEPYSVYITKDLFIPGSLRFTHEQIIGSTGTGKTRYVFYPHINQDIVNGAGLFIYDIKSNMRKNIESYVSQATRDYDLYTFNLGDPGSAKYNPLANGSAMEISNRVFTALYGESEGSVDFYKDYAEQFLSNVIAVLKAKIPIITFKHLYQLTANPTTLLKQLCLEFEYMNEAKYLIGLLKTKDLDDRLLGLLNKLNQFATPKWTEQINTTNPDFQMSDILNRNKILLFQANSGLYQQEYKPISILALKDLQTEIARRYEKPPEKPFFIYLDEFYNVLYKDFGEMINKAREAKVGLIFGHQSMGDLKKYGESLQNIILTSSRHKIVLNVGESETAEYFSKLFGTQTVKRKVESHKEDGKTAGYTDRFEEEFEFHPNLLKSLKTDRETDSAEAIILIQSGKGRIIEQVILSHIKTKGLGGKLQKRPEKKTLHKETDLEELLNKTAIIKAEPVIEKEFESQERPGKKLEKRFFKRKGVLSAREIAEQNKRENANEEKGS